MQTGEVIIEVVDEEPTPFMAAFFNEVCVIASDETRPAPRTNIKAWDHAAGASLKHSGNFTNVHRILRGLPRPEQLPRRCEISCVIRLTYSVN